LKCTLIEFVEPFLFCLKPRLHLPSYGIYGTFSILFCIDGIYGTFFILFEATFAPSFLWNLWNLFYFV
jgi:hypothetical protein